jgi:hypothetical protein
MSEKKLEIVIVNGVGGHGRLPDDARPRIPFTKISDLFPLIPNHFPLPPANFSQSPCYP